MYKLVRAIEPINLNSYSLLQRPKNTQNMLNLCELIHPGRFITNISPPQK